LEDIFVIRSIGTSIHAYTLAALAVAMLWEALAPRRELQGGLVWRWANNFSLSLVSWYVAVVAGTLYLMWLGN